MDIEILLILQQFREGAGAFLTDFLAKATFFGELNTTVVMLAIVYWCISKEVGEYLLMGWSGNRLLNGFMKITVCAYRPWIRDKRIIPYGTALATTTGYSFPSGHATNASTVFGGQALRKKTNRPLRIALIIIVILIGFSRAFLGVHTPQDVIIGTLAGMFVMWLTIRLMKWIKDNPHLDYLVTVIGLFIACLLALYAAFKSYPIDLDEAGNLIVDGTKMALDTFKAVGWSSGFFIGWLLERRYVNFESDVSMEKRMTRLVLGMIGLYIVMLIIMPEIKQILSPYLGTTLSSMLQMFYISFIFPLLISKLEKQ